MSFKDRIDPPDDNIGCSNGILTLAVGAIVALFLLIFFINR